LLWAAAKTWGARALARLVLWCAGLLALAFVLLLAWGFSTMGQPAQLPPLPLGYTLAPR
jgi:hypothetical protein